MGRRKKGLKDFDSSAQAPAGIAEDPESQPRKGKRGRQTELPGVMPEVVDYPEITKLAQQIKAKRSEWQEVGSEISKMNDRLIERMKARGLTTYVSKHFQITIVDKERVKIKDIAEEEAHEAA